MSTRSKIDCLLGAVLTAIVTPFREDGSVNPEGFRELCLHLVGNRRGV